MRNEFLPVKSMLINNEIELNEYPSELSEGFFAFFTILL